jgi:hypothetical protein
VARTWEQEIKPLFLNSQTSAQWVKLSESWPKLKMFDFDEMLKNLPEGQ